MHEYWNHNTAYHAWLVGIAARKHGHVLDVGCGDGLLVQRPAAVSAGVLGIDPDPAAVARARRRLRSVPNASVALSAFAGPEVAQAPYDLITFVASLHHLPLRETLQRASRMLAPGGEPAVVGLAANKGVADWAWAALCTPPARAGSWLHRETRDIGVVVAPPHESLDEIRRAAADVLPGARIRRGLYCHYRLHWRKP